MFIDKRNEYPTESDGHRGDHAELDYHNRRLQDKKMNLNYLTTWRVTIISPVTNSVGKKQWANSDKPNSAGCPKGEVSLGLADTIAEKLG